MECLQCNKVLHGNENKKFCNDHCKNSWHNARRKAEIKEIGNIINILKSNRRIILEVLAGKEIRKIPEQLLLDKGFVFRYHTHHRVNKGDGKEYTFCFDYGYLKPNNGWLTVLHSFK